MGNEMGNRNVTEIQGEESTAIQAPETISEAAAWIEDLKGENHVIPEVESNDFHEKIAQFSDEPFVAEDSQGEKIVVGKEQTESKLKPPAQSSEGHIQSDDEAIRDTASQRTSSPENRNSCKNPLGPNLTDNMLGTGDKQMQKHPLVGTEDEETNNLNVDSVSALVDADPKPGQHEHAENLTELLVEDVSLSLLNHEEVIGPHLPSFREEKVHLLDYEASKSLTVSNVSHPDYSYVEQKESDLIKNDMDICKEKSELLRGIEVGNDLSKITPPPTFPDGLGDQGDVELPPEIKLGKDDSLDSYSEAVQMTGSLYHLHEVSVTRENCTVPTEETKLIANGTEIEEDNFDTKPTEAVKGLKPDGVNAFQLEKKETIYDSKHNQKGTLAVSNSSVEDRVHHIEEAKVTNNENQVDFDDYRLNSVSEEKCKEFEQVPKREPKIEAVPTQLTVRADLQEKEMTTEKSTTTDIEKESVTEECVSQPHKAKKDQDFHSSSLASPFNTSQHHTEDTAMGFEAADNRKILMVDAGQGLPELRLSKVPIGDSRNPKNTTFVSATEMENQKPGRELSFEAREKVGRFSTEANPENPSSHVELRKSPSFHFDLALGARAEESDQTPLLHHKTAKTKCARDFIDYENVPVEEKTIRMERSDSENPRTSSLSLLIKEEKANIVAAAVKQEGHVRDKKAVKDSRTSLPVEVALTSSKGSGKHKPRAFLFSTCICCAAAIH